MIEQADRSLAPRGAQLRSAEQRQHAAFRDQLLQEAPAPGADRDAQRDLTAPHFGPGDEQVRDVCAGDHAGRKRSPPSAPAAPVAVDRRSRSPAGSASMPRALVRRRDSRARAARRLCRARLCAAARVTPCSRRPRTVESAARRVRAIVRLRRVTRAKGIHNCAVVGHAGEAGRHDAEDRERLAIERHRIDRRTCGSAPNRRLHETDRSAPPPLPAWRHRLRLRQTHGRARGVTPSNEK